MILMCSLLLQGIIKPVLISTKFKWGSTLSVIYAAIQSADESLRFPEEGIIVNYISGTTPNSQVHLTSTYLTIYMVSRALTET